MSKNILALELVMQQYLNGDLEFTPQEGVDDEYYDKNERLVITDSDKYEMIRRGVTAQEALDLFIDNSVKKGNKESTLRGKIKRIKSFVKYLLNYNDDDFYYLNFGKIEPKVISDYLSSRTRNIISLHVSSCILY